MHLRFATTKQLSDSAANEGVFQAAFDLRDSGALSESEAEGLAECLAWLQMHLKSPDCLRAEGNHRAVCWFKPRARKPMQYVWRLVHLLRDYGRTVEVHKTRDPGVVLYEAGWQVVAKPRRRRIPRKADDF